MLLFSLKVRRQKKTAGEGYLRLAYGLELKTQSHDDVAIAILRSDLPEGSRGNARGWRPQIRVVEDVVPLSAELQPHPLVDGLPPAHHGIEAECSGVAEIRLGTRAVSEAVRRGRGVRSRIEPLIHVLSAGQVAVLRAVFVTAVAARRSRKT